MRIWLVRLVLTLRLLVAAPQGRPCRSRNEVPAGASDGRAGGLEIHGVWIRHAESGAARPRRASGAAIRAPAVAALGNLLHYGRAEAPEAATIGEAIVMLAPAPPFAPARPNRRRLHFR